ncbi:MAG TPA: hypothetical protein VMH83_06605, partial [Candidatus Acidoferrum sp.]|nr:hypothetical protein [Candidatus Acidoferrum sp.]
MSDAFQVNPPTGEQENPYVPAGSPKPLIFEEFAGINTSTTRPGVADNQAWWIDGFMPIGRRFLRTMPDVGAPIHQESGSATIAFFAFGNIGTTPYCIVFHNDGSLHAINTITLVAQTIAPAGTITNPSRTNQGLSQWGSTYILIVSNQTNGYFVWDGSVFYQPGSVSPIITITNGGTGYTSPPT